VIVFEQKKKTKKKLNKKMQQQETWKITFEERSKHNAAFQSLKPDSASGLLSGVQARKFFLKSELATQVLDNIWHLADLNKDGQLDQREFSIACYLIRRVVFSPQGSACLPSTIPHSLTLEPAQPAAPAGMLPYLIQNMNSTFNSVIITSPSMLVSTAPLDNNNLAISPISTGITPKSIQTRTKYTQVYQSQEPTRAKSLHLVLKVYIWNGPKRASSKMAFSRLRQKRQTLTGRVSSRHAFV
jgi:hypothetical protein